MTVYFCFSYGKIHGKHPILFNMQLSHWDNPCHTVKMYSISIRASGNGADESPARTCHSIGKVRMLRNISVVLFPPLY